MEYKYYLKYSGRKDSNMFRAAIHHLDTFPLWRDSKARVVNYEEYREMLDKKEIAPAQSYRQIEKGQVGVVTLSYYMQYSKTWSENIDPAFQDFNDGWRACEGQK